jgi:acyl carrier protein
MRNLTHVIRTLVFVGDCRKSKLVTTNSTALKNDTSSAEDLDGVTSRIRAVLAAHGRLGTDPALLSDGDDLYAAGMVSLASVNVMLALEGEFDIEFPDHMLNRSMFSSMGAIEAAVRKIARG